MKLSLLLEPEDEIREEGEIEEDGLACLQSKESAIVNRKERGEAEGQISLIGMKRKRQHQVQHFSYSHLNLHQIPRKAMDLRVTPLQNFVLLGAILSSFVQTR